MSTEYFYYIHPSTPFPYIYPSYWYQTPERGICWVQISNQTKVYYFESIFDHNLSLFKTLALGLGVVTHACNASYLREGKMRIICFTFLFSAFEKRLFVCLR
jgi:hypothetical protein